LWAPEQFRGCGVAPLDCDLERGLAVTGGERRLGAVIEQEALDVGGPAPGIRMGAVFSGAMTTISTPGDGLPCR
jgi:hypothetical protein